ncbi:MAG: fructose-bisphosphate aldolase, partial [Verrucomicrobiota bacterium]|nr:fructose-bisphosphate aldolase [Verrucomicrobiota bacterium]
QIIDSSLVPVIVLGGASMGDDQTLFSMVRDSLDAGASGIAIGRNVWQHERPVSMARSLSSMVHDDASVSSAMKLLDEPLS